MAYHQILNHKCLVFENIVPVVFLHTHTALTPEKKLVMQVWQIGKLIRAGNALAVLMRILLSYLEGVASRSSHREILLLIMCW